MRVHQLSGESSATLTISGVSSNFKRLSDGPCTEVKKSGYLNTQPLCKGLGRAYQSLAGNAEIVQMLNQVHITLRKATLREACLCS